MKTDEIRIIVLEQQVIFNPTSFHISAIEPHSWELEIDSQVVKQVVIEPQQELKSLLSYENSTQTINFSGDQQSSYLAGKLSTIKIKLITQNDTQSNFSQVISFKKLLKDEHDSNFDSV